MHLNLLLEMASSGYPERTAITFGTESLTYQQLSDLASAGAMELRRRHADAVLYVGANHPAFPVALFSAAAAGVPFVPLNYRLGPEQLQPLGAAHPGALVVSDDTLPDHAPISRSALFEAFADAGTPSLAEPASADEDDVAIRLYTSGTTGTPKAALLRHRHLMSYVFATVEFGSAGDEEAALVTVPPYHIAGIANLLSNLFAGRRIVYLDTFDPSRWLDAIRSEGVTQAMVVPTMLARVVRDLDGATADVPTLRTLSYGGSRAPLPVIEQALRCFPDTGFVNAYGLTETSSTIALLGPDDHRAALDSANLEARTRLSSVGRLVPGIEVEVRDDDGQVVGPGQTGAVLLRGEQVSGEYDGGGVTHPDGWFPTGDRGWVDKDGYLFIEGRADDTIIRGGENIAPAEIEDVLMRHPAVVDAAVVGIPDDEWGQRIAAAVTLDLSAGDVDAEDLQNWVRQQLRSSKTPDLVAFRTELPRTATGKLLRRDICADLTSAWRA